MLRTRRKIIGLFVKNFSVSEPVALSPRRRQGHPPRPPFGRRTIFIMFNMSIVGDLSGGHGVSYIDYVTI